MTFCLSLTCSAIASNHLFGPDGGTFGRSNKCDWTLPDPERILSSIHARIMCQGGTFFLLDESTNGTFLAGEANPIGRGRSIAVSHGMTFVAGRYEIETQLVRIDEPAQTPIEASPSAYPAALPHVGAAGQSLNPLTEPRLGANRDTIGVPLPGRQSLDPLDYLGGDPVPDHAATSAPGQPLHPEQVPAEFGPGPAAQSPLPHGMAPQAMSPMPDSSGVTTSLQARANSAAPLGQGVRPMPTSDLGSSGGPVIPDVSDFAAPSPQAADNRSVPTPSPAATKASSGTGDVIPEDFLSDLMKRPSENGQSAPKIAGPIIPNEFEPTGTQKAATSAPVPADLSGRSSAANVGKANGSSQAPAGLSPALKADEVEIRPPLPTASGAVPVPKPPSGVDHMEALKARREKRVAALEQKAKIAQRPPSSELAGRPKNPDPLEPPSRSAALPTSPSPDAKNTQLVAALLKGLGFPDASVPADKQEDLMSDVGAMARELAEGMVTLLSARKMVKSEFRMDETQIQPEENNPYKLFKVGELALDEMLLTRTGGFLSPEDATKAAFQDIQGHTIVMMTAMQRALKILFERVSPEALADEGEADGGLRIRGLGARKGKWEAATQNYQKMSGNFEPVIRQIIMEAFAQVQEEQARRTSKEFWEKRK
ncbi:type VI secretion system-associated FHA domain protein TagH [Roseibium polysiphoniae]|uniref:Type VI secretion system-associated FHA domain protein TagH n=1 Tax=Roseibium polysiphoniae TaxID=2571221 RepID=A0A944GUM0_9HYPH|nr:type VI secretion system-associated FHA domain protein TagH [Roseibium polysiphoniae]